MLAAALKDARKRARKTLRDVAEATGLSIGFISDIEHGRRRTTPEVLEAIQKVLGVKDNALIKAGQESQLLKEKLRFLYESRPQSSFALARLAEDLSDEDLLEMLKTLEQKR
ncbi:hypothetical protein GMLC_21460 [Geomonas limicola]|uniref:HTH cro/C1-type domain-containing protein n=1 Tax=Geomonas limicola TaxID=2740186 RepID=A0A6V8N9S8_9BACT|nr:helix-turn-helix transcriptional regulator [Geomonas limicola]GFO68567.1 hypothetical protein GMLC_21460 [Geomonas limicola]